MMMQKDFTCMQVGFIFMNKQMKTFSWAIIFLLNIKKIFVGSCLSNFHKLLGIAYVEFKFAVTSYNENIVKLPNYL